MDAGRPPLPPFTTKSATLKVRLTEDSWNGRDPATVSFASTPDSPWRNRTGGSPGEATRSSRF